MTKPKIILLLFLSFILIPCAIAILEIEEGKSECIPFLVTQSEQGVDDASVWVEIWLDQEFVVNGSATHLEEGTYCYNSSINWATGNYLALANVTFDDGNVSSGSQNFSITPPTGEQIGLAILLLLAGGLVYLTMYRVKSMRFIANILFMALASILLILYDSDTFRAIGVIMLLMGFGSLIWDYFTPMKVRKTT